MLRLLFISLVIGLTACSRSAQPQAAAVPNAVEASNREAQRLYQVEPFEVGHGTLRQEGGSVFWEAFTSVNGNDFKAKVKLNESGAVLDAQVRMFVHPDITAPPTTPEPGKPETSPVPIPEVMPKVAPK
ncbi:MAG: hypothetical protein ACK4UN_04740 [Limisphaerales bacterium]